MRRVSIAVCSALLTAVMATAVQGCSSSSEPAEPGGTGQGTSGSTATAGSTSVAGSTSAAGSTSVAGSTSTSGGTGGTGGEATAGTTSTAGTSAGGTGGTGTGGTAGASSSTCPAKVENGVTACTAECFDYKCGVWRLGSKDCACTGGFYDCESCVYSGTEEVVQAPAEALPTCAESDTVLEESQTPCTKGDRCYYYDSVKARDRLCACWDDGLGSFAWDCDTYPGDWPKP